MDHANAEILYQITQRMDVTTGIRDKVLRFLAQAGVVVDEMRVDPDKIIEARSPSTNGAANPISGSMRA
jgi:hypothetical protein